MFNNHVKLTLKSHRANDVILRDVIKSFMELESATLEEIADMRCAASEAFMNAVDHAYQNNTEGLIEVEIYVSEDRYIHIVVKDYGKYIENVDWAQTMGNTSCSDGEHIGMGFTIMKSFTDVLNVNSFDGEGTTVHLAKMLS